MRLKGLALPKISSFGSDRKWERFKTGERLIIIGLKMGAGHDVLQVAEQPQNIPPMASRGWSSRITMDGILVYSGGTPCHAYTQIYRNGIIEAVEGSLLNHERDGVRTIPSISYEQVLIQYLPVCFNVLRTLGADPPMAVFLTLTNVRGVEMSHDVFDFATYYPIGADTLLLPEAVIQDFDEAPAKNTAANV